MWQGALRNPEDSVRDAVIDAIEARQRVTVELLYSDQVGRQRTISRFGLFPATDSWLASLTRHWYLDWDGPRPEDLTLAAVEAVIRDRDAAAARHPAAEVEFTVPDDSGPPDLGDSNSGLSSDGEAQDAPSERM
jgi:hypothetical protein